MATISTSTSTVGEKSKAVDLVTGKATQEYFFDPTLVLPSGNETGKTPSKGNAQSRESKDTMFFQSKYLFVPCTIIKPIVDEDNPLVPLFAPVPLPTPVVLEGNSSTTTTGTLPSSPVPTTANNGKKKKKKKGKGGNTQNLAGGSPSHDPAKANEGSAGGAVVPQINSNGNGGATLPLHPNLPYPGPTLVKTSDGALHKISDSTRLVPLHSPADYEGVPDILRLPAVSEAALLHTLRIRYRRDEVYTAAGQILISINPYKAISVAGLSIYSEQQMMIYRRQGWTEKPPHLFQVADRAYTALMDSVHNPIAGATDDHTNEDESDVDLLPQNRNQYPPGRVCNQSIIISGESGAGKTEATKIIMTFLAKITRKKGGAMIEALADRVLSSNPLLESFGNAQTLRNNNSSRFGKFIHIYFSCFSGAITGASISNYLLEKTRITHQIEGERNYHIFYQLLSGADDEMLRDFGLENGIADFRYLSNKGQTCQTDADAFSDTVACLTSIGLTKEDQHSAFGMAAAVLHLGNIQFEEGESENAKVSKRSLASLFKACELLGLDVAEMSEAVLTKVIVVNGKPIHKPQNVALAEDKRDALAKMTYSCLFLWLVNCINDRLQETSSTVDSTSSFNDKSGFIGVLDIYGFECFETNGFEQLLINYCNETLQRHFNRHLFEVEQELYSTEGVDWSYITFNDNRPCLELIEGGSGGVGILSTLDEAWSGMGTLAKKDEKFAKQLRDKFGSESDSHPNFITSKFGSDGEFIVVHYAGGVKYTVDGFVEKNMETMSNELRELGEKSTKSLITRVYSCSNIGDNVSPASTRSSIRGVSVGCQFRTSLQALVTDIERTQPHYIRCIKPNLTKSAGSFMASEVLKQLRHSGMMEAIRIRQDGYALREEHESFFDRFSVLLNADDIPKGGEAGIVQLVTALSKRLNVSDADWQVGHSKIFLRRGLSEKLERMAKVRIHCAARVLTRFGAKVARERAARFIVTFIKFRKRLMKQRRIFRAASRISGMSRVAKHRRHYSHIKSCIVRIQAVQRRRLALHKVRKMKDPFYDITFRDCKVLLVEEKKELELAVKNKNFNLATKLETKIIAINEAIERKKPITRASIDEQVSVLKAELEDCVKRLAFDECGPLQDKLEELTLKQADLPTINELRAAVTNAENAMANAARNRDFAGAAVAQSDVEKAKQRLLDNLAADDDEAARAKEEHHKGILSRSDLETRIADIVAKLDAMTIANDLSTVTTWRVKLQEYEGLRNEFPTIEELRQEIFARKVDVEEAVSKKAFSKAGELNDKLAGLENKLAQELLDSGSENYCSLTFKSSIITESGENVTFSSRFDLEQQVESTTLLIAKLVGERDFKKAAAVQANLDELFNQRKHFLSVEELQLQLQSNTIELQSAIANMRFADADRLQCNQIEIERKIAFERTSVPIPLLTAQNGSTDHSENVNITSGLTATNEDNNSSVQPTLFIDQPYSKDINLARTTTIPIAKINSASVKSLPLKSAAASDVSSHIELTTSLQPVINVAKLPPEIQRTVAKLRPATPLIGLCADTVLSVAQRLTDNRCSACIIVGKSGGLAGIITDTDITRRIVAKRIDPATATASSAMTPSPRCVATTDSALDALTTMVENHFRHLPVVDEGGNVVGILDIAKCLNDAITKLERNHEKSNSSAEQVVKQVMSQQMTSGAQAASLVALLSNLMAQAFGGLSTPTLRSLITGKPNTIVSPEASISKAGLVMAESRKAALVVKDNELVGVFTFKDMMSRVVAKGLNLDQTVVSKVMTPCPESITPDKTVLEALQIMHDQRILTLPVCEKNGEVVGLVDVMDVIHGCGGAEGWKSIFNSAIGLQDDQSDIRSISVSSKAATREIPHEQLISGSETTRVRPMSVHDKSVAKLRPMQPCIASTGDSILSVVQLLKRKRSSASFIVNSEGSLVGIVTDTDITRRVVAKYIDVNASAVSSVMTTNPTVVEMSAPATDALMTMVENHFRHLPVVDEEGSVVGLLDVAKCLDDAITKLEKSTETKSLSAEDVVKQAIRDHGGEASQTTAMLALLGTLLSKTMGDRKLPSLRSLLAGKPSSIVSPDSSIRDAGIVMAESRKAALIVKNGELVGIFSFKDCMNRAVAAELPLEQTPVSEVMTQNPEFASPDITVLEALQIMRDQRFLTLPVCEQNGTVVGVVDVMDIIYGCGGADGWKSIFNTALDIDDNSAVTSGITKQRSVAVGSRASNAIKGPVVARIMPNIPPNIPATLEFDDDGDNSFAGSTIGDERGVSKLLSPEDRSGSGAIGFVVFKVSCPSGSTHRIRCEATVQDLVSAITSKISNPLENMRIEYEDDEGDTVVVSSDDDVAEAFNLARKAGKKLAKLTVVEGQKPPKSFTTVWVGGGLAAVALLGAVAFALLRPKK